jgi:hypothetical protein
MGDLLKSPTTLHLLVDTSSTPDGTELQHLLSFERVDGIKTERVIEIEESSEGDSIAVVGPDRDCSVLLPRLSQYRDTVQELSERSGGKWRAEVIERVLGLVFLAEREGADGVVTAAKEVFTPSENDLLNGIRLLSVGEGLAMIGAHVRQRESVPLRGVPPLQQERTEVYPITARAIIPTGQAWWSACVHKFSGQGDITSLAEAVFKRLGQTLRGRDGIHEALRTRDGRAAILEALYHLDVLLTSGVAALDALARVAHYVYATSGKPSNVGWQKSDWLKKLAAIAPGVAAVLDSNNHHVSVFAVLRFIRNSIHSIPLDEFLYVERGSYTSRVEHRVMMSADLLQELHALGSAGFLESFGIFDGQGSPWMNVGQFAEEILTSIILMIDEIFREMLATNQLPSGPARSFEPLFKLFWDSSAALARVGEYPYLGGSVGLQARPSEHRWMMGVLHRAEQKLLREK